MGGQNHHFQTLEEEIPYAIERYVREVNRLYSVLDQELATNQYIGGDRYHIADMAIYPWIWYSKLHQIEIDDYKNVKRWFIKVRAKESVRAVYLKRMKKLNFDD